MTVADSRLAFRWWPSFSDAYAAEVEVTEGKRATTYAVAEEVVNGGEDIRLFLVRKQGTPAASAYRVRTYPRGRSTCSCPGAVHRHQRINCRHAQVIAYLTQAGVL